MDYNLPSEGKHYFGQRVIDSGGGGQKFQMTEQLPTRRQ